MYSCHLLLISSASVRSLPFLSFIVPIFTWNIPLVSLIFWRDLQSFPFCCFLYFFSLITEEGFLISHCYSLELCIQMCISFLFSFTFYLSSFLSYLWGLFRWTFCFLHVFFLGVVLNTASCTMSWTFIHNSLGTLSDLTPWIYLSLPLYNCKGFNLGHSEWSSSFPYFLQFKSEFGNKDFMIWATVSSQSYFFWLYRASPSLASKNITNLILVLTIWWRSLVFSCVVIRDCLLWAVCSLGKTVLAFALLHFVLQSQTCLLFQISLDFLLFAFLSPVMKRTSFLVLVLEGFVGHHRIIQLQLLQH